MLSGLCALGVEISRQGRNKGSLGGRTLSNGTAIGALFEVHPQAVGWSGEESGWKVRRQEGTGGRRHNGVFNGAR